MEEYERVFEHLLSQNKSPGRGEVQKSARVLAGKDPVKQAALQAIADRHTLKDAGDWVRGAFAPPQGRGGNQPDTLSPRAERTETGNAHRLVARHGQNIRYVYAYKSWLIWTGVYWKRDDGGEIRKLAEETVETILTTEAANATGSHRADLAQWYYKSRTRAALSAMIELAQHQQGIPLNPDQLDADPMLLGVRNGTIDLRTGTFRQSRREDYITLQAAVAFDQAAKCPNWLAFLDRFTKDQELLAYKGRLYGLMLTGRMVEILFILHGWGSNGKTTEQETILELLGDYALAVDASVLIAPHNQNGPTPEIVALKGKRMVAINEFDEDGWLSEQRVKYLCSTDKKAGRGLYEKLINFDPTYKIVLKTNHKPKVKGAGFGLWRRIHFVPYYETISMEEKDDDYRGKMLSPERPGILNWMLEGLRDYLEQGGKLKPPKVVSDATDEYRHEQDVIGRWATFTLERGKDDERLSLTTLHDSYRRWSEDEIGWTAKARKFAEVLREMGYESVRSNGVLLFKNIRFKQLDPPVNQTDGLLGKGGSL